MITKEELEIAYYRNRMSMKSIAKEYNVSRGTIQSLMRKHGLKCRSRLTALALRGGDRNHNWKGGRRITRGYVEVLQPNHNHAGQSHYVLEHVLVWEQTHGRALQKGWVVHHINGIKHDNRSDNLMAMPRKSHHYTDLIKILQHKIKKLEAKLRYYEMQGVLIKDV